VLSPPGTPTRLRPPWAVPVPQETAAPVTKESASGSGTSVCTGTFMYLAWPPWPPEPRRRGGALEAHLSPATPAMLAVATAVVVMVHDTLADAGLARRYPGAD